MSDDMSTSFLDDDEDEESTTENKSASAFAQMRKELKASKKELEELRVFKVEQEKVQRVTSVAEAFKGVGLNPKHAKFYPADSEPTPEAIKEWALAEDFIKAEEGEAEAPPPPEEAGFTPTVVSGGATPGAKVYTAEEFDQLMLTDPTKAMQVYKAGRVQKEQAPGGSVFAGRDR